MSSSQRHFTIQGSSIGHEGGRYSGKMPSIAAKKAAKVLFRMLESDEKFKHFKDQKTIKVIMREVTAGSAMRVKYYTLRKVHRPKAEVSEIQVHGKPMEVKSLYKYEAKSCGRF